MKRTYSRKELVDALERAHLTIRTFSLRAEGAYPVEDAIWNYRDAVAHLTHLHPQVLNVPIVVEPNRIISLFFQKLFFLRFPITVVDQLTDPFTQTSFTNCFFFTLIVENRCRALDLLRSEVITTYTLGIPRVLFWTFPLLKWILKRNYQKLMSTDIPCRERRGVLRQWGYQFASDHHSFVEAQMTVNNHVILPKDSPVVEPSWPEDIADGETVLIGRSDHLGRRITRQGDQILIFERMCLHEGANLDKATLCKGNEMRCPWHGRVIRPIRILSYADFKRTKRTESQSPRVNGSRLDPCEVP